MAAYYNEIDPFAAEWLRNLIKAGHIASGEVDTRSIVDVKPDDLRGFTQCHFFAGIGGWSLALRLAGWADDRFVWTGSCPCQPFSSAGKQSGSEDERHLWPAFFGLIRECRPRTVFGEQVASALGRAWLDHVCADLESAGYAAAAANLPACSVGSPHIRQRLWFVAESDSGLGDAKHSGLQEQRWIAEIPRREGEAVTRKTVERGNASAPWDRLEWLPCRDGKARPTQPGLQPLADGVSGRVGRLRAYGNAIVPQVAAEVIMAFMEVQHG